MVRATALLIASAVLIAACGTTKATVTPSHPPRKGPTVVVASFNFSESQTLAQAYGQKLKADGFPISLRLNLGPRQVIEPSLKSGEISFIPEYLGAVLSFVTNDPTAATSDVPKMYTELKKAYSKDAITALPPSRAQDNQGYAVTQATHRRYGINSIVDLKPHAPKWVLGGPPECPVVPECLSGLGAVYGLKFKDFRPLDSSGPLTVLALQGDQIQVAVMNTTSGFIPGANLVELEDPKGLASAQNIVPVVRKDIVKAYGKAFERSVNAVSKKLTTSKLAEMNKRVDVKHEDPQNVAVEWLKKQKLVK